MAKNEPLFWIQIVDKEGVVAKLPGGGALEAELIDLIANTIVAKGVGLLRSEATVNQRIREGTKEAIMSLKRKTIQLV